MCSSDLDHFWNVGANEDGRHRFIQSSAFTVGGAAENPVVGTGMDGVTYLRSDKTNTPRVQGYYRNANGIRSEEHTSELQSHSFISYAVFCLKKKKK